MEGTPPKTPLNTTPAKLGGEITATVPLDTVLIRVDRGHLARSLKSLEAVNGRLLGLVLNMIPTKGKGTDAYYYYHQSHTAESPHHHAKDESPHHHAKEHVKTAT